MEHSGRAVADGFSCALVVADPSYNELSVAKELAGLAQQIGIKQRILVVNRIGDQTDVDKIGEKTGRFTGFSRVISLLFDPEIIHAGPAVNQLLSGDAEFTREVRNLVEIVSDQDKSLYWHEE